jgi:NADH dehydrogenase
MPVLVTGATGVVGRALVPRLVEVGGQVRVYVRRDVPEYRALGVKVAIGDADHEGRLESALEQVHTIVHLVGGPVPDRGVSVEWLNFETTEVALRAAENAEVRRFLFLSPIGADPGSPDPYLAAKGRAEAAIRDSALEHVIFRSTPVFAPEAALVRALGRGAVPGPGTTRTNPIALDDVVEALVAADTRESEVAGSWELGGPEVFTVDELAARLSRGGRLGRLLAGTAKEIAWLGRGDAVADPAAAAARFGLGLTPISPSGAGRPTGR